jgi:lactoylglutathione lyase
MVDLRYAILYVSDLDRSARIYRDAIGLPVRDEDRDSMTFTTGETALTLQQAHQDAPHHRPLRLTGTVRLGFHVKDLTAVHERLRQSGVTCTSKPEEQLGVRMALYEDPDGFTFTVASDA